jgi:hypothetical protein
MPVYRGELSSVLRIDEDIAFCCIFSRVDCEIFQRKMVSLMSGYINEQFTGYYLCVVMDGSVCYGSNITGRCLGDLCCTVVSGKLSDYHSSPYRVRNLT